MVQLQVQTTSLERKVKSLLPSSLKAALTQFLCIPPIGWLLQQLTKNTLLGFQYPLQLVDSVTAARIFFGIHESAEIRFALRHCTHKAIVVELGCSIGVMAAALKRHKSIDQYIAVEPSTVNVEIARKVFRVINKDVVICHKAISYGSEEKSFLQNTGYITNAVMEGQKDNLAGEWVDNTTLSTILQEQGISGNYTLITDIEGAEADVFFKDVAALEKCDTIIAELEETEIYSMEEQAHQLKKLGFVLMERYGNVFAFSKL
jgi:FkbM family methyltransferase